MAGLAVADCLVAPHHVVVDAVGLHLAVDTRVAQAEGLQLGQHGRLGGLGVDGQLSLGQRAIAVVIEGRYDLGPVGAVLQEG